MNSRDKSAQPVESTQSVGFRSLVPDDPRAMANPYSPAREVEIGEPQQRAMQTSGSEANFPSMPRTVLRWSVVCGIAAAPSFVMGLAVTQGQALGMLLAIVTFICLYVAADLISRHWPIRRNVVVRRTLVFVYVTRIVISVIFPVGMYIDIVTGSCMMFILEITANGGQQPDQLFNGEIASVWLTYRMTFVHAVLMNILLSIFGLLSFPFVTLYTKLRSSNDDSRVPAEVD